MAKWNKKQTDASLAVSGIPGMCIAFGCPMHGVMSGSAAGKTDDYTCHAHFRSDYGHWPVVTDRLKENLHLVELSVRIRQAMTGKLFNIKAEIIALKRGGYFELLPSSLDERPAGGFSIRKWSHRLEHHLFMLATHGLQDKPAPGAVNDNIERWNEIVDGYLSKNPHD